MGMISARLMMVQDVYTFQVNKVKKNANIADVDVYKKKKNTRKYFDTPSTNSYIHSIQGQTENVAAV